MPPPAWAFLLLLLPFPPADSILPLHPSDLHSLLTFRRELGLSPPSSHPCNAHAHAHALPGVICDPILSANRTHVLRVTRLVFPSRGLRGSISPALGRLPELRQLSLPNNDLIGRLPSQIFYCKKLEILDLRNNRFAGLIPPEISSLVRLRELDLSSNGFSGNLSFLKHFTNIQRIDLSNNLFTGKVPASVRSFRYLTYLDFSGNDFLQGPPPGFRSWDSEMMIPRRYALAEHPGSSTRVNITWVSVTPAPQGYSSFLALASAPSPSVIGLPHKRPSLVWKMAAAVLGFLVGATGGITGGFLFSMLYKKTVSAIRGGGKSTGPSIFSPLIKKADHLAFLEKEDALQSLEIIGKGGCGIVYKTDLPGSDGKVIAIKKITQPPKEAAELTEEDSRALNRKMRQIRTEIRIMGEMRHKNLLPLLAHMSRPDCHYLVYEFMKNGSLQDMLEKVSGGTVELDWLSRHRIALGVAAGLEYLHCNHHKGVVHRDLKPANVLLDDDMEAKIADFGLSKEMREGETHVTSTSVVGTLGYIAPEYHSSLKFTEKSDVYSYGVMLGALVSGKLPSDEYFKNTQEMGLVKWLRGVVGSEEPGKGLDERLRGNGYEEQMVLALKVAYFCTLEDPRQRPTSKDVRCMLSQINRQDAR